MAETTNDTTAAPATDTGDAAGSGVAPATTFSPSGAPHQVVPDVDPAHPAVDNDPRANTTVDMNRIDFNDPRPSHVKMAEDAATAAENEAKAEAEKSKA